MTIPTQTIIISPATRAAILAVAARPVVGGLELPSGSWLVPIRETTLQRFRAERLPGEALDDTINRMAMECVA